jgi:hypothetical protein
MTNLLILRSLTEVGYIDDCAVRRSRRKWACWDYSRPLFSAVSTITRGQFIADKTLFGRERSPQCILLIIKVTVYYHLSAHIYIYILQGDSFIVQCLYNLLVCYFFKWQHTLLILYFKVEYFSIYFDEWSNRPIFCGEFQ